MCVCVCMRVCVCVELEVKRASDHLEQELQTVVSYLMWVLSMELSPLQGECVLLAPVPVSSPRKHCIWITERFFILEAAGWWKA